MDLQIENLMDRSDLHFAHLVSSQGDRCTVARLETPPTAPAVGRRCGKAVPGGVLAATQDAQGRNPSGAGMGGRE